MNLKAFTIYDSKIGAYGRPFMQISTGEALRTWHDLVNDPQHAIHKHPEDFTLFELGSWSDEDGRFSNLAAPVSLGVGIEVHRGYQAENQKL